VGCYIWYSEERPGRAAAPRPVPSSLYQTNSWRRRLWRLRL